MEAVWRIREACIPRWRNHPRVDGTRETRWTITPISTLSVYDNFKLAGIREVASVSTLEDETVEDVTTGANGTYGPLKALCEQAAEAAMPGRVLNVRAGLLVGPYDPTDRWTYVAGSLPVGAVVVDPSGAIAAEARNRIFDSDSPPPGQLAGSWLAHAELNAIAQIEAEWSTQSEGWAVYTTLEPCPMCAGAIIVAFRGRIRLGYASGDPGVGGLRVLTETGSGRRRQWQIEKLSGPLAVFAELLHAVYAVESRPTSRQASYYREPPWGLLMDSAGAIMASGRERNESVEQVLARLWAEIEPAQLDKMIDSSSEVR